MNSNNFDYFQGSSLSDLFTQDVADASYAFILNYPATANWVTYPNTQKYLIQDGSDEASKTSYSKIFQNEPWKNLAVLGNLIPGILVSPAPKLLLEYWHEHLNSHTNIETLKESIYLDCLNDTGRFDKFITLFPFDCLKPEKHAVLPDTHYHLLSKATLGELGVPCPKYQTYNLDSVSIDDIELPEFPYLIKTSHGLSGEGTYIIQSQSDLDYCFAEIKKYAESRLLSTIIVSEFIKNVVNNYCVQFYISKTGDIQLIGVTNQIVTSEGNYIGGLIHYRENMSIFFDMIAAIGQYAHSKGYFGVIGFDVLQDRDGYLYVIDANFRVNGSTPLCLQRHTLLKVSKEVANYSTDYQIIGTLESTLKALKAELERKDFIILSAQEFVNYGKIHTEIYGIVTGETIEEMQHIEQNLKNKGLITVG
ncbi:carbamoylphosphate synthase large subunit [Calothrix sp. HK-06]|nr:carbamoylphosphate synthase large subunit [Calothrix sp. HK-06]